MSTVSGRREKGMFTNGSGLYGSRKSFASGLTWYTDDSYTGDGCWAMNHNTYGGTMTGSEYIEVDPDNKHYIFSLYVKTITRSYNGRLGSGHLGFVCYDKNKKFIAHDQVSNTRGTTLTRAASPGDNVIYIARGDWYVGSTGHARSFNFFPSSHPDYGYFSAPGRYGQLRMYSGYLENGIEQISSTEWKVNLSKSIPDWGYDLPVGTNVYNSSSGGTYNYALGAPNYPEEWTLYKTGIMHGYGNISSAGFRWGTKYIRFLNLKNYNYRSERSGDSARYLLDNIQLLEVKNTAVRKLQNLSSDWFTRRKVLK